MAETKCHLSRRDPEAYDYYADAARWCAPRGTAGRSRTAADARRRQGCGGVVKRSRRPFSIGDSELSLRRLQDIQDGSIRGCAPMHIQPVRGWSPSAADNGRRQELDHRHTLPARSTARRRALRSARRSPTRRYYPHRAARFRQKGGVPPSIISGIPSTVGDVAFVTRRLQAAASPIQPAVPAKAMHCRVARHPAGMRPSARNRA